MSLCTTVCASLNSDCDHERDLWSIYVCMYACLYVQMYMFWQRRDSDCDRDRNHDLWCMYMCVYDAAMYECMPLDK